MNILQLMCRAPHRTILDVYIYISEIIINLIRIKFILNPIIKYLNLKNPKCWMMMEGEGEEGRKL